MFNSHPSGGAQIYVLRIKISIKNVQNHRYHHRKYALATEYKKNPDEQNDESLPSGD